MHTLSGVQSRQERKTDDTKATLLETFRFPIYKGIFLPYRSNPCYKVSLNVYIAINSKPSGLQTAIVTSKVIFMVHLDKETFATCMLLQLPVKEDIIQYKHAETSFKNKERKWLCCYDIDFFEVDVTVYIKPISSSQLYPSTSNLKGACMVNYWFRR